MADRVRVPRGTLDETSGGVPVATILNDRRLDPRQKEHLLVDDAIKRRVAGAKDPANPPGIKSFWSKDGIEEKILEIKSSPDGNAVKIIFCRPATKDAVPCVMYLHGGGMEKGSAFEPIYKVYTRWLAKCGVAAAMVDFRNSLKKYDHPQANPLVKKYPGGLDDCCSAASYLWEKREELGIKGQLTIAGESGGANLAVTLALRWKRDGLLGRIAGLYIMCPYLAGEYPQEAGPEGAEDGTSLLGTSHLDSPKGFNRYKQFLAPDSFKRYLTEDAAKSDPITFAGYAKVDDLRGLPRFCIQVDEADPLRDEGKDRKSVV